MARNELQPACPRCGYDLSGEIARWKASCPTEGLCTECGLDITWRDLLSPRFARPRASVEHDPIGFIGRKVIVSAVPRTWLRVALPWLLWRDVKLEHPVRLWRVLLVVLLLALPGYAVMTLFGGMIGSMNADLQFSIPRSPHSAYVPGRWLFVMEDTTYNTIFHSVYAFGVPLHTLVFLSAIRNYSAPPLLHIWPIMLVFGPLAHAVMGASFLCLFQTLGRIKVRRVHLLRGVVYAAGWSLGWALLALALVTGSTSAGRLVWDCERQKKWYTDIARFLDGLGVVTDDLVTLVVIIQLVWLPVYWWWFAKRYLRLPNPTRITLIMLAMTTLCMISIVFYSLWMADPLYVAL